MKLKELIKNLQEDYEKYGNVDVIYATDEEGNGFHDVYSTPTPVERLSDSAYMTDEDLEMDTKNINALIIN